MAAKFTVGNHTIKVDQRICSTVLYIDDMLVCEERDLKKAHLSTSELNGKLLDKDEKTIRAVIRNGPFLTKVTLYVNGVETGTRFLI